uniref:Ig-like domain-containing protein n=1 Tax=Gouania willdenowi TaxID=441366 RepID=A0A8C5GTB9_GOUWI
MSGINKISEVSNSDFFFLSGFTEINVSCVYNSICILSCSFRYETDVLHWDYITRTEHINVHSYYENKDQFEDQDPRFNGRTSLVEDQVTGRKTSLMLKNVKVQDEGTYRCFISNDDYGAQTGAAVWSPAALCDSPLLDMVRAGNSATCSSEGVYPEPNLTWSSSPQSNSTVQQTEEKLYNISSSLKLSDMDGDLLLSCTVSTRLNKWTTTTTWRNPSEEHNTIKLYVGKPVISTLLCSSLHFYVYIKY